MTNERESDKLVSREQLEEELSKVVFTDQMKERVMASVQPSFWEREIQIPIYAVPAAALLFIFLWQGFQPAAHFPRMPEQTASSNEQQYVVVAGGLFPREVLEKRGQER